jgi:hypothetical protein
MINHAELDPSFRYLSKSGDPVRVDIKYARSCANPPLNFDRLTCRPSTDISRAFEGIHAGGDLSYILYYKEEAAFMMSYKTNGTDLWVVQMQGSKNKGYRVNTGMDVPRFFADQTCNLLFHPGNTVFDRVLLPDYLSIQGINIGDRKEGTQHKYDRLRELLGMKFNPDLNAFVLDRKNNVVPW